MTKFNTIGLMSGTSMDGIDASILNTNGIDLERYNANSSGKYSNETKNILLEAEKKPTNFIKNQRNLHEANILVTKDHIKLINQLINEYSINVELIGFHGQTIFHDAKEKISIQIGDPQFLANQLKIDVVSNFRKNDLINGGQGAPLAPVYHQMLIKKMNLLQPTCFINIGGVANLTYWDGEVLIGFDTGPGNGLLDKFIKKRTGKLLDKDGLIAKIGNFHNNILSILKSDKYFTKPPPKSLDKLSFSSYLQSNLLNELSTEDGACTLSLFTVETIADALKFLPRVPETCVIMGGGSNNKFIMKCLKEKINAEVFDADELNLPGQYIEAELMAFLAARTVNNLPITFSSTTGTKKDLNGGVLYKFK